MKLSHSYLLCMAILAGGLIVGPSGAQELLHFLEGPRDYSSFGQSVDAAGDIDGDGFDDLVVGAPEESDPALGFSGMGAVRIYSGRDGSVLRTWFGPGTHHALGSAVAGLGDVNGDGVPDIGASGNESPFRGKLHVFSGSDGGELYSVLAPFTNQDPTTNSGFPGRVRRMGDVDGDGVNEILTGAQNYSHIPGGVPVGAAAILSGRDGSVVRILYGLVPSSSFGWFTSGAGDIDADGSADVLIGDPNVQSANGDRGAVYLYSGRSGSLIFYAQGSSRSSMGRAVSGLGDLDADGYGDFAYSDMGYERNGFTIGKVWVRSGRTQRILLEFEGPIGGLGFGQELESPGDFNRDGIPDLAVKAQADYHDPGRRDPGVVWIYSGRTGLPVLRWVGEEPEDGFGSSVRAAGDVNADGYPDLLVGASGYIRSQGPLRRGAAYVFGGNDIFLQAAPREVRALDILSFKMSERFDPFFLFAVEVNSLPVPPVLVATAQHHSGTALISFPVPPGISGTITFDAYSLDFLHRMIRDASPTVITFR